MAASQDVVLRAKGLTKRFGPILAVDHLDLEVRRGEIYGYLGLNGAGKTTTIGMVLGLIAPSEGELEVLGKSVRENLGSILHRVGAIVEAPALYPYLSGRDNLRVFGAVLGGVTERKIDEVLEIVGLSGRAGDKFKTYSQGMKQRLGIGSTLLNDPELVILDEPTNGLDPAGMVEIRELIRNLAGQGRTVFLSSHLLHEVEQVCSRVAILKQGKLIAEGSVADITARREGIVVRLPEAEQAAEVMRGVDWVSAAAVEGDTVTLTAPVARISEVSKILAGQGLYPSEIRPSEGGLESFFLEVTGENGEQVAGRSKGGAR